MCSDPHAEARREPPDLRDGDWVGTVLPDGAVLYGRFIAARCAYSLELWPGYTSQQARVALRTFAARDSRQAWWIVEGHPERIEAEH